MLTQTYANKYVLIYTWGWERLKTFQFKTALLDFKRRNRVLVLTNQSLKLDGYPSVAVDPADLILIFSRTTGNHQPLPRICEGSE